MKDELTELKDNISGLSDEELLTMVNVKAADYRKEALDYAIKELAERGVAIPEDASIFTIGKTSLPISFDNVHYYYNKSLNKSWLIQKYCTGDLVVTKGVMYYFPHTVGRYIPEGAKGLHLGLIPNLLIDVSLATTNKSRLRQDELWLNEDTSQTLQKRLDAYINELKKGNSRPQAASLFEQSAFKWWRMLLSKEGRTTLPYPERFTRQDIKSVDVSTSDVFTFYVGANNYTFKIGPRRKQSFSDALREGEFAL